MANVKTIPALGRSFSLGMLYDRCAEKLIPNQNVWSEDQINSSCESIEQCSTTTNIFVGDTLDVKASMFNLDPNTKLSFIGQLFNVEGAAKYFYEGKSSCNQARVVLKIETTVKEEVLKIEDLIQEKEHYPEDFDDSATDVVVGITYGSNTIFVFDKEMSENETLKQAQESIKILVKEIPSSAKDEKHLLEVTEAKRSAGDELKCTVYSDMSIEKRICDYHEAINAYKQLLSLVGENMENAVPVEVRLLPLSEVNCRVPATVKEVNDELVREIDAAHKNIEIMEASCNDLIEDEVCSRSRTIKTQLTIFKSSLVEHRNRFQKELGCLLPEVRKGMLEELSLKKTLTENEDSPFSQNHMKTWIELKQKELKILKGIFGILQKTPFIRSLEDVEIEALSSERSHVLCYTLRIAQEHDVYLESMDRHLNGTESKKINSNTSLLLKDKSTLRKLRESALQFMKFREVNENSSAVSFFLTEDSVKPGANEEIGGFVYHYENGLLEKEDFQLPLKPDKPVVINVSGDAAELQFNASSPEVSKSQRYEVHYLHSDSSAPDVLSTDLVVKDNQPHTITLTGLCPATTYKIRIRSVCSVGVSEFSDDLSLTTQMTKNSRVCCDSEDFNQQSNDSLLVLTTNEQHGFRLPSASTTQMTKDSRVCCDSEDFNQQSNDSLLVLTTNEQHGFRLPSASTTQMTKDSRVCCDSEDFNQQSNDSLLVLTTNEQHGFRLPSASTTQMTKDSRVCCDSEDFNKQSNDSLLVLTTNEQHGFRLPSASTCTTHNDERQNANTSKSNSAVAVQLTDGVESGCQSWISSTAWKPKQPQAPGKPFKVEARTQSITIAFDKPAMTNPANIKNYKIEWRIHEEGKLIESKTLYTRDASQTFTIKDLKEATNYNFRVTAVYQNSEESAASDFSDAIQTLKSPPRFDVSEMINQCEKIQESSGGVPAVFELPLDVEYEDKRAKKRKHRVNLGSNDMTPVNMDMFFSKPEKIIMVVGATGSGKTTLINGMINHVLGVRWEDPFRLKMVHELSTTQASDTIGDQTQSQTQYVSTYTLPYMTGFAVPYNLTIVDTPGFGDTRGIDQDSSIVNQIHSFFQTGGSDGIDHIDAICFLVQAGNPRLTPTQQYVFDKILSMFGKDIKKNICVLFTFADGQKPQALSSIIKANILEEKDPYFKFNNSALYVDNSGEDDDENFDRMFWKMGIKSFDKFFAHLGTLQPRSLVLTNQVLHERAQLEVHLSGLMNKINCGINTLSRLQQEERIFNQHATDIDANRNFKYVVYEDKRVQVKLKVGSYTTNCLTCNYTCHFPCGIPNSEDKNRCWAMTNGQCRQCPNKCHWQRHVNDQYRYDTERNPVEKEFDEIKDKYDTALQGQNKAEAVIRQLKDEFDQTQVIVLTFVAEMQRGLKTLSEIALKKDPLQQVDYIDLLISSEKSQARPGWQDRVGSLRQTRKKAEQINSLAKANYDPWRDFRENEETRRFFEKSWHQKLTQKIQHGCKAIKSAVFGE